MLTHHKGSDRKRNLAEPGPSILGKDPLKPLVGAEIVLLATVTLCTLVIFNNQANIYGISYFGIQTKTVPILAAGFVSGGSLLFVASARLPYTPPWKLVGYTLRIVGVGIVLLLLTPYTLDTFSNWTHMTIGAVLFATEMYTGTILCFRYSRDRFSQYALIVQFIGGLLAMFSLPDHMLTFMLEGELTFQVGFSLLLNHAMHSLRNT